MSRSPQIGVALLWVGLVIAVTYVLLMLPPQCSILLAAFSSLGLVSLAEDDRIATANRVREALSILQIPIHVAAEQYMDWDYREFKRALNGEKPLNWWRLAMIGPEFRRVYAMLELRDLGAPAFVMQMLKIEPALQVLRREA